MKKLFLLFTFFAVADRIDAQKVTSSCAAHDTIIKKYRTDADRMALRRVFKVATNYIDSAAIPKHWSDTILKALLAVYNADSLPAKDTVVSLINIHTFPQPVLDNFYMAADSNLHWMQQIRKKITPTGADSVDALISAYHLHLLRYYRVKEFPYHIIILESDRNYNFEVITNLFDSLGGVHYANRSKIEGDGNDIKDVVTPTYVELVYSFGWNDCLAGCNNRRFWKFRVYYNCSVEYMGSYGNKLNIGSVSELFKNKISISPNPFKDKITLYNLPSLYEYKLFNSSGQLVRNENTGETSISNLETLPAGIYFLQLKSDNKMTNFKLIKE